MKLVTKRKQVQNFKGEVFYGVHMYPGLSESGDGKLLYISDQTIRKMGPTLAGCPIFCGHRFAEGSVDEIRTQSAGTVVESFFNDADGLHWIKFIIHSTEGLNLISRGYGLSNGYEITQEGPAGRRNGVEYDSEVLDGEFNHVALVKDPRYDSIILTPSEFKAYNDEKRAELRRVANSKEPKKGISMKRKIGSGSTFYERKKVANSKELETLSVMLPKSGVEKTIDEVVKLADKFVQNEGKPRVCKEEDVIVLNEDGEEKEMTIGELVEMVSELRDRVQKLEEGEIGEEEEYDDEDDVDNEEEYDDEEEVDEVDNADDEDDEEEEMPKKKMKNKSHGKKSVKNQSRPVFNLGRATKVSKPLPKKKVQNTEGKARADKLRGAHTRVSNEDGTFNIDSVDTKLARGMDRYG